MVHSTAHRHSMWRSEPLWALSVFFVNRRWSPLITSRCKYARTMRRWISQNNIRLPRGAFFISALFFFNAVCIVSDNLLIIESFGEMAYNISYLTRVPGTNTLLACCCLSRPEEVNSEYWRVKKTSRNGNRRLYRAKNRRAEQEYRERSLWNSLHRTRKNDRAWKLWCQNQNNVILWTSPVRGDVPLVANLVTNHWRLWN